MKRRHQCLLSVCVAVLLLLLAAPAALSQDAGQLPDAEQREQERIRELEAAIASVEAAGADTECLAYRTNLPLAKLQLKKARLLEKRAWYRMVSVDSVVREGLAALERLDREFNRKRKS